ncbi:hypothetical protein FRC07_009525 [Ceratobasidium sp. 392]|nr:hypothetical protein FRC07_009525 [Ceratobasidium sp. 392]
MAGCDVTLLALGNFEGDKDYVNSDDKIVMLSPPKAIAKPKALKAASKIAISKPKKSKTADSEHMESTGGNRPNKDPKEFELIPFSGWTEDWMDFVMFQLFSLKVIGCLIVVGGDQLNGNERRKGILNGLGYDVQRVR